MRERNVIEEEIQRHTSASDIQSYPEMALSNIDTELLLDIRDLLVELVNLKKQQIVTPTIIPYPGYTIGTPDVPTVTPITVTTQ